jgi:hypothetical protein
MYTSIRKGIFIIIILSGLICFHTFADLRDYIVIVKPLLPKTTEANFNKIADQF